MSKVTLDMDTFKALASDTRLDILRVLDGKNMSLKDISNATKLNKATLHEHLTKLHEAGLIREMDEKATSGSITNLHGKANVSCIQRILGLLYYLLPPLLRYG